MSLIKSYTFCKQSVIIYALIFLRVLYGLLHLPQKRPTFHTLLMAYPLSLSVTAMLILTTLLIYRPAHRTDKRTKNFSR